MKRIAFVMLTASTLFAAQPLTEPEKQHAVNYLAETRDGLVNSVKGLSAEQWKFKPAPDRWSAAEVVEHLALLEDLLAQNVLGRLDQAPAAAAGRDPRQLDASIPVTVPDRSVKLKAPQELTPSGRWTGPEALEHYLTWRAHTAELLNSTPNLRDHVIVNAALGALDGYQWVLAVAAHSARHTKQILEVKADPNFPVR